MTTDRIEEFESETRKLVHKCVFGEHNSDRWRTEMMMEIGRLEKSILSEIDQELTKLVARLLMDLSFQPSKTFLKCSVLLAMLERTGMAVGAGISQETKGKALEFLRKHTQD